MEVKIIDRTSSLAINQIDRFKERLTKQFRNYHHLMTTTLTINELKRKEWKLAISVVPKRGNKIVVSHRDVLLEKTFQSIIEKVVRKVNRTKDINKDFSRETI